MSPGLLHRYFSWFENRIDSFPLDRPRKPPGGLFAFVWFYTRPFMGLLSASVVLSAASAFIEV